MSTITKQAVQAVADLKAGYTLGHADVAILNELARIALASLEADGALANEGTITATQFKPVADLYEVTVPSGRSTTFTKDAAEASDCRVMGWSVQEYVKLERYQAAMLQGADGNSPVIPDGWVACSERMPERDYVLAADFSGKQYPANLPNIQIGIYADWFDDGSPCWDDGDGNDLHLKQVTHWAQIPAAPQQEVK